MYIQVKKFHNSTCVDTVSVGWSMRVLQLAHPQHSEPRGATPGWQADPLGYSDTAQHAAVPSTCEDVVLGSNKLQFMSSGVYPRALIAHVDAPSTKQTIAVPGQCTTQM